MEMKNCISSTVLFRVFVCYWCRYERGERTEREQKIPSAKAVSFDHVKKMYMKLVQGLGSTKTLDAALNFILEETCWQKCLVAGQKKKLFSEILLLFMNSVITPRAREL